MQGHHRLGIHAEAHGTEAETGPTISPLNHCISSAYPALFPLFLVGSEAQSPSLPRLLLDHLGRYVEMFESANLPYTFGEGRMRFLLRHPQRLVPGDVRHAVL